MESADGVPTAWQRRPKRLSTAQAAARLGVKPATLYAYVSRGLLHSQRVAGERASSFDADEVERLLSRSHPAARTRTELVIESGLTAITSGRLFYRGLDAVALAEQRTFEEVAEWLWHGSLPPRRSWHADPVAIVAGVGAQSPLPVGILPLDRLRVIAAAVAATDHLRYDIRPQAVLVTARSLLAALVDCLPRLRPEETETVRIGAQPAPHGLLAARLWARLCPQAAAPALLTVLNAALILVADHELSASTLAARVAASVQADPYAVVGAGLCVLSGPLHGAASLAAESLLAEIEQPQQAARVIGERLRRGERVPGFGHLLYPDGDPRCTALLTLLRRALPASERLMVADALLSVMRERALPAPNIDFALAMVAQATGMARGAGEVIFAVARTAGWIAHALEEYGRGGIIRPRALYTGPAPRPVEDRGS